MGTKPEAETTVQEAIDALPEPDRDLGLRLQALIAEVAPHLTTRLWYGMPAWAKDGKVLCFFQPAAKFRARYATLGFSDQAGLDDGALWPTAFALRSLEGDAGQRVRELVARAAG